MDKTSAFVKTRDWLEKDSSCDLYMLNDLLMKMEELASEWCKITPIRAPEQVQ